MPLNRDHTPLTISILINGVLLFILNTVIKHNEVSVEKRIDEVTDKLQAIEEVVLESKRNISSIQEWSIKTNTVLKQCDILELRKTSKLH